MLPHFARTSRTHLLAGCLAALLVGAPGCGSGPGSDQGAQGAAAASVAGRDAAGRAGGSSSAGSLTEVRRRLEAKGYQVEDGFPTGQATRAITIVRAPGVDISAFRQTSEARIAWRAARRLGKYNPGRVMVRLRGGTRLYYAQADHRLTHRERATVRAVVAAGEGQ